MTLRRAFASSAGWLAEDQYLHDSRRLAGSPDFVGHVHAVGARPVKSWRKRKSGTVKVNDPETTAKKLD